MITECLPTSWPEPGPGRPEPVRVGLGPVLAATQVAVLFNPGAGDMRHDAGTASGSRHISERIDRARAEVYEYASDPANLPYWAPGLGTSVEEAGGQWFVHTPEGRARFAFAARNDYGVLDHHVSLPSGEIIYVPMRVIADGNGSEMVFTLRRRPGMTDDEFARDAGLVTADLARLRQVLQSR